MSRDLTVSMAHISPELQLAYRDLDAILSEKHSKQHKVCQLAARFVDEYLLEEQRKNELLRRVSYVEENCRQGTPFWTLAEAAFDAYHRWQKTAGKAIDADHRGVVKKQVDEALTEARAKAKIKGVSLSRKKSSDIRQQLRQQYEDRTHRADNELAANVDGLEQLVVGGIRWRINLQQVINDINRAEKFRTIIDPEDRKGVDLQNALEIWNRECNRIQNLSDRLKSDGCYFLYHAWQAAQPEPQEWALCAKVMLLTEGGHVHFQPMRDAAYVLMYWQPEERRNSRRVGSPKDEIDSEHLEKLREAISNVGKDAKSSEIEREFRILGGQCRRQILLAKIRELTGRAKVKSAKREF